MPEDLKRLLAKDGDRQAAEHLWNLALRQGDDDLATLAATALGDGQKLGQLGSALWQKADWTRLESLSRGFGVVLDKSAAGKIDGLMRAAHHGRLARLLSRAQVLEALWGALCSGDQYCFAHAGGALASPGRPMTTVVLVVARETQLTLGIAAAGAAMPSPGRGWTELQPWRRDERAANLVKLAVWAAGTLLPTKCLVSRTECPQAEVFRARDERQREVEGPLLDLEGALDEGDGPETFKRVVRLLDKWPKSHATALPSAVQLATERCRDWPVEPKEAGKAWLNRALKGDIGNKPTDPLYKHLELRDVTDQTFAEMASCEALTQIESAELHFHPNHNHNNDHAGLRALMGSQVLRGLRQLTLHTPTYGERWGLGILMSSPNLPALERLQVYGDDSLVDGLDGYALDLLALERSTSPSVKRVPKGSGRWPTPAGSLTSPTWCSTTTQCSMKESSSSRTLCTSNACPGSDCTKQESRKEGRPISKEHGISRDATLACRAFLLRGETSSTSERFCLGCRSALTLHGRRTMRTGHSHSEGP